jgi:hypothetical protein
MPKNVLEFFILAIVAVWVGDAGARFWALMAGGLPRAGGCNINPLSRCGCRSEKILFLV